MSMNPGLTEMVAQTRIADMQRAAVTSRGVARRHGADASPAPMTGAARPASVRKAIGWFLVGVGLRLAASRTRSATVR